MALPEINGGGRAESLWTKAEVKKKPVEEQTPTQGMTAAFLPNGGTFMDAVHNLNNSTGGNNCAGI